MRKGVGQKNVNEARANGLRRAVLSKSTKRADRRCAGHRPTPAQRRKPRRRPRLRRKGENQRPTTSRFDGREGKRVKTRFALRGRMLKAREARAKQRPTIGRKKRRPLAMRKEQKCATLKRRASRLTKEKGNEWLRKGKVPQVLKRARGPGRHILAPGQTRSQAHARN